MTINQLLGIVHSRDFIHGHRLPKYAASESLQVEFHTVRAAPTSTKKNWMMGLDLANLEIDKSPSHASYY
jgi:hypothetical protein